MYDQLDTNGQVVRANFQLGMYDTLPEGHSWVEHVDTLDIARQAAWIGVKAERERLSNDGGYKVTVNGTVKWFHSDSTSQRQQMSLVLLGANVPAVQWKTMDGSKVTMTQALASQIFQAGVSQGMAIFAAGEAHYSAIKLSLDPASYDFSNGWPEVYLGV
jgi:hypothetical protein